MPITVPRVITFSDEVLRPLAEKMRNLDVEISAAIVTWNTEISTDVPNSNAQQLEDGRESDGVSRIHGQDIHNLLTQFIAYKSQMDGAGVRDVISKPTVRPLET